MYALSRISIFFYCGLIVALFPLFVPSFAYAHVLSYGAFHTQLDIADNQIHLESAVPLYESLEAYGPLDEIEYFNIIFQNDFAIRQNGQPCHFSLVSFDNTSTADQTSFKGTYLCPQPITSIDSLSIHNDLFSGEFINFDHFVTINLQGHAWSLAFNPTHEDYPTTVQAKPAGNFLLRFVAVAGEFIWLGVKHIWTGYDHILFLLSVVLLARSIRKVITLVTAFTIAHSVTLLLASFHVIEISARIVEPAIALTIAYMALRNIFELKRNRPKDQPDVYTERWLATFCFGLVHGLGFASALAATEIPNNLLVPSLLSFNVGIELGQLSILAIVLPVLLYIDRLPRRKIVLLTISAVILLLAILWFSARVFLGESCASFVHYTFLQILCI